MSGASISIAGAPAEAATAAAPAVTSSEERTVWIEVTRNYFRGGVMHKPGARIPVRAMCPMRSRRKCSGTGRASR